MRAAEAHAVVGIAGVAAIAPFLDVVCEQAVLWCRLFAALAVLEPFATIASGRHHGVTKRRMACRMVERVDLLRLRPCRSPFGTSDART
jgi:hypothetical protein